MAQIEVSEDELRDQIMGVLRTHRYILPFEQNKMLVQIMKLVKSFIASQSMQKPF